MILFAGPFLDYFTVESNVDGVIKLVTDYNPLFMVVAGMYVLSAVSWFFIDCTDKLEVQTITDDESPDDPDEFLDEKHS